jgi:tRNA splicing endonuclease
MGIRYDSLDESVRSCMVQELDADLQAGRLYASPRLNDTGKQKWPVILREALLQHDDVWLADALRSAELLNSSVPRHNRDGSVSMTRMPDNAADTLAEGEFNRFYARGLCVQVLASRGAEVEVYRGKDVQSPRPESEVMIGKRLPATQLLDDLRQSIGVDTAMRLPPGPNSGLTVRRIQRA